jgi:hypothetical protein
LLLCRWTLRLPMNISALAALTAAAPEVPFVGRAILGDLFGSACAIPISIASLASDQPNGAGDTSLAVAECRRGRLTGDGLGRAAGDCCFMNRRYHTLNLKEKLNGYYTRLALSDQR